MAKKGGPNKSAAIRDYLQTKPDAKPKEIVDKLKSQGLDVTAAFVSTIKSKLLSSGQIGAGSGAASAKTSKSATAGRGKAVKGAARKKVTRKARAPKVARASKASAVTASKGASNVSIEGIVLAKKLAEQLGGVEKARAALAALEKITG